MKKQKFFDSEVIVGKDDK
jgi:hypothetical protein